MKHMYPIDVEKPQISQMMFAVTIIKKVISNSYVLLVTLVIVHWYSISVQREQWIKLKTSLKEHTFHVMTTINIIMKFTTKSK